MIGLRALVLNSNYTPISLFPLSEGAIPVEDAITRVINGTCHVVSEYDRKILTSARHDMKWPSVIVRKDPVLITEGVRLDDESLFYRDHGMCAYCQRKLSLKELTCDHVVPKSKGGAFVWDNIVAACPPCNTQKGDQMPTGKWRPRIVPTKPSYYDLLAVRRNHPITVDDDSWTPFLGYWNAPVTIRMAA